MDTKPSSKLNRQDSLKYETKYLVLKFLYQPPCPTLYQPQGTDQVDSGQERSFVGQDDLQVDGGGPDYDETDNSLSSVTARSLSLSEQRGDRTKLSLDLTRDISHSGYAFKPEDVSAITGEIEKGVSPEIDRLRQVPVESPILSHAEAENEVVHQIRTIGDEVNVRFANEIRQANKYLLGSFTYEQFKNVMRTLTQDINASGWHQVALVMSFSQQLAFFSVKRGQKFLSDLGEYTTDYIMEKSADFIIRQGGWGSIQKTPPESPVFDGSSPPSANVLPSGGPSRRNTSSWLSSDFPFYDTKSTLSLESLLRKVKKDPAPCGHTSCSCRERSDDDSYYRASLNWDNICYQDRRGASSTFPSMCNENIRELAEAWAEAKQMKIPSTSPTSGESDYYSAYSDYHRPDTAEVIDCPVALTDEEVSTEADSDLESEPSNSAAEMLEVQGVYYKQVSSSPDTGQRRLIVSSLLPPRTRVKTSKKFSISKAAAFVSKESASESGSTTSTDSAVSGTPEFPISEELLEQIKHIEVLVVSEKETSSSDSEEEGRHQPMCTLGRVCGADPAVSIDNEVQHSKDSSSSSSCISLQRAGESFAVDAVGAVPIRIDCRDNKLKFKIAGSMTHTFGDSLQGMEKNWEFASGGEEYNVHTPKQFRDENYQRECEGSFCVPNFIISPSRDSVFTSVVLTNSEHDVVSCNDVWEDAQEYTEMLSPPTTIVHPSLASLKTHRTVDTSPSVSAVPLLKKSVEPASISTSISSSLLLRKRDCENAVPLSDVHSSLLTMGGKSDSQAMKSMLKVTLPNDNKGIKYCSPLKSTEISIKEFSGSSLAEDKNTYNEKVARPKQDTENVQQMSMMKGMAESASEHNKDAGNSSWHLHDPCRSSEPDGNTDKDTDVQDADNDKSSVLLTNVEELSCITDAGENKTKSDRDLQLRSNIRETSAIEGDTSQGIVLCNGSPSAKHLSESVITQDCDELSVVSSKQTPANENKTDSTKYASQNVDPADGYQSLECPTEGGTFQKIEGNTSQKTNYDNSQNRDGDTSQCSEDDPVQTTKEDSSEMIMHDGSQSNEDNNYQNTEYGTIQITEDETSHNIEGDTSQNTEGDSPPNTQGDTFPNTECDTSQSTEGDTSQRTEGDTSQRTEGDTSQKTEGDTSQTSSEHGSSENIKYDASQTGVKCNNTVVSPEVFDGPPQKGSESVTEDHLQSVAVGKAIPCRNNLAPTLPAIDCDVEHYPCNSVTVTNDTISQTDEVSFEYETSVMSTQTEDPVHSTDMGVQYSPCMDNETTQTSQTSITGSTIWTSLSTRRKEDKGFQFCPCTDEVPSQTESNGPNVMQTQTKLLNYSEQFASLSEAATKQTLENASGVCNTIGSKKKLWDCSIIQLGKSVSISKRKQSAEREKELAEIRKSQWQAASNMVSCLGIKPEKVRFSVDGINFVKLETGPTGISERHQWMEDKFIERALRRSPRKDKHIDDTVEARDSEVGLNQLAKNQYKSPTALRLAMNTSSNEMTERNVKEVFDEAKNGNFGEIRGGDESMPLPGLSSSDVVENESSSTSEVTSVSLSLDNSESKLQVSGDLQKRFLKTARATKTLHHKGKDEVTGQDCEHTTTRGNTHSERNQSNNHGYDMISSEGLQENENISAPGTSHHPSAGTSQSENVVSGKNVTEVNGTVGQCRVENTKKKVENADIPNAGGGGVLFHGPAFIKSNFQCSYSKGSDYNSKRAVAEVLVDGEESRHESSCTTKAQRSDESHASRRHFCFPVDSISQDLTTAHQWHNLHPKDSLTVNLPSSLWHMGKASSSNQPTVSVHIPESVREMTVRYGNCTPAEFRTVSTSRPSLPTPLKLDRSMEILSSSCKHLSPLKEVEVNDEERAYKPACIKADILETGQQSKGHVGQSETEPLNTAHFKFWYGCSPSLLAAKEKGLSVTGSSKYKTREELCPKKGSLHATINQLEEVVGPQTDVTDIMSVLQQMNHSLQELQNYQSKMMSENITKFSTKQASDEKTIEEAHTSSVAGHGVYRRDINLTQSFKYNQVCVDPNKECKASNRTNDRSSMIVNVGEESPDTRSILTGTPRELVDDLESMYSPGQSAISSGLSILSQTPSVTASKNCFDFESCSLRKESIRRDKGSRDSFSRKSVRWWPGLHVQCDVAEHNSEQTAVDACHMSSVNQSSTPSTQQSTPNTLKQSVSLVANVPSSLLLVNSHDSKAEEICMFVESDDRITDQSTSKMSKIMRNKKLCKEGFAHPRGIRHSPISDKTKSQSVGQAMKSSSMSLLVGAIDSPASLANIPQKVLPPSDSLLVAVTESLYQRQGIDQPSHMDNLGISPCSFEESGSSSSKEENSTAKQVIVNRTSTLTVETKPQKLFNTSSSDSTVHPQESISEMSRDEITHSSPRFSTTMSSSSSDSSEKLVSSVDLEVGHKNKHRDNVPGQHRDSLNEKVMDTQDFDHVEENRTSHQQIDYQPTTDLSTARNMAPFFMGCSDIFDDFEVAQSSRYGCSNIVLNSPQSGSVYSTKEEVKPATTNKKLSDTDLYKVKSASSHTREWRGQTTNLYRPQRTESIFNGTNKQKEEQRLWQKTTGDDLQSSSPTVRNRLLLSGLPKQTSTQTNISDSDCFKIEQKSSRNTPSTKETCRDVNVCKYQKPVASTVSTQMSSSHGSCHDKSEEIDKTCLHQSYPVGGYVFAIQEIPFGFTKLKPPMVSVSTQYSHSVNDLSEDHVQAEINPQQEQLFHGLRQERMQGTTSNVICDFDTILLSYMAAVFKTMLKKRLQHAFMSKYFMPGIQSVCTDPCLSLLHDENFSGLQLSLVQIITNNIMDSILDRVQCDGSQSNVRYSLPGTIPSSQTDFVVLLNRVEQRLDQSLQGFRSQLERLTVSGLMSQPVASRFQTALVHVLSSELLQPVLNGALTMEPRTILVVGQKIAHAALQIDGVQQLLDKLTDPLTPSCQSLVDDINRSSRNISCREIQSLFLYILLAADACRILQSDITTAVRRVVTSETFNEQLRSVIGRQRNSPSAANDIAWFLTDQILETLIVAEVDLDKEANCEYDMNHDIRCDTVRFMKVVEECLSFSSLENQLRSCSIHLKCTVNAYQSFLARTMQAPVRYLLHNLIKTQPRHNDLFMFLVDPILHDFVEPLLHCGFGDIERLKTLLIETLAQSTLSHSCIPAFIAQALHTVFPERMSFNVHQFNYNTLSSNQLLPIVCRLLVDYYAHRATFELVVVPLTEVVSDQGVHSYYGMRASSTEEECNKLISNLSNLVFSEMWRLMSGGPRLDFSKLLHLSTHMTQFLVSVQNDLHAHLTSPSLSQRASIKTAVEKILSTGFHPALSTAVEDATLRVIAERVLSCDQRQPLSEFITISNTNEVIVEVLKRPNIQNIVLASFGCSPVDLEGNSWGVTKDNCLDFFGGLLHDCLRAAVLSTTVYDDVLNCLPYFDGRTSIHQFMRELLSQAVAKETLKKLHEYVLTSSNQKFDFLYPVSPDERQHPAYEDAFIRALGLPHNRTVLYHLLMSVIHEKVVKPVFSKKVSTKVLDVGGDAVASVIVEGYQAGANVDLFVLPGTHCLDAITEEVVVAAYSCGLLSDVVTAMEAKEHTPIPEAQSKPGPVESKPKTPTRKPHQISVGLKEWVRLYVDHVLFRTTQQTDTKAFTTRTPIPVFSSTSSIPFPDSRYGSSVSSVTTEHSTISVIHVETQTSRAQVVEHLPARLPKVDSKCVGVTPDCLDEQRSAETGENDKDIEVVKQWLDNTGGAYKEVKSGSSQSSATSRVYEGDDGHLIVPQDRRSSVDTGTKNLHVSEPSNDQSEETIQVPSRPHSKSVRASPTYPEDQAWKLVHRASAPPLSKEQTVALSALTVTPSDEPDVCTLSPLSYQPQTTSRSSSTRIRNPPRALTLPFATDCVSHVPGVGLSDQDALLLRTTDAASRQSRSRTHMHQMVINLGHRICDMLSSTTADDSTAGIWPWCAVGVAVGLVGVYCLTRNSSYPRLLSVDNNNVRSVVWIPSVRLENFVSPD